MSSFNLRFQGLKPLVTPEDIRLAAKDVLPRGVFDFIDGGAGDESTLDRNGAALSSLSLTGKMLRGNVEVNTHSRVFEQDLTLPIAIAPMAYHGMVDQDAELATARAAANTGIPLIVSTMSTVSFEMMRGTGAKLWFQLYVMEDQRLTYTMIDEAVNSGCQVLVLTIDVPVFGRRLRDERNNFRPAAHFTQGNKVRQAGARLFGDTIYNIDEAAFVGKMFKSNLTWEDIQAICQYSPIPVVLKGIMCADDATKAKQYGAAGVIVSNHGGRQFDSHPASMSVLPSVRKALGNDCNVAVDGGFKSASDIVKGIASGADLVLLGRTILYALAVGGETLLTSYLTDLNNEIISSMKLLGLKSLQRDEITATINLHNIAKS